MSRAPIRPPKIKRLDCSNRLILLKIRWWRRWESNPRPETLQLGHLHTYPVFKSRSPAPHRQVAVKPVRLNLAFGRFGRSPESHPATCRPISPAGKDPSDARCQLSSESVVIVVGDYVFLPVLRGDRPRYASPNLTTSRRSRSPPFTHYTGIVYKKQDRLVLVKLVPRWTSGERGKGKTPLIP